MTEGQINALYTVTVDSLVEIKTLFVGSIDIFAWVAAMLIAWGVVAFLIRKMTSFRF